MGAKRSSGSQEVWEPRGLRGCPLPYVALPYVGLNISRYISTAVGEEEISLVTTNAGLVELENAIKTATGKHNGFLKELGLPLLPTAR